MRKFFIAAIIIMFNSLRIFAETKDSSCLNIENLTSENSEVTEEQVNESIKILLQAGVLTITQDGKITINKKMKSNEESALNLLHKSGRLEKDSTADSSICF